jgi:uncharacterized protein (TIGR02186 family)
MNKNSFILPKILFILSIFSNINSAYCGSIISGISTNKIEIDTEFTGAEVLLFGAKGDSGNIIITVRGPKKNYIVSKKDRFLGVWYNKDRIKFSNAYSYYGFFSSGDSEIDDTTILSPLEIGVDHIKFDIQNNNNIAQDDQFKIEFINKLEKNSLYLNNPNKIEFLDETLFKAILKFPKNISRGVYLVEIYLIDKNNLVSFQSIPITVNQVGLSAKINHFAYNNSVIYGIFAVLMATIAGFLANFIFTKIFNK